MRLATKNVLSGDRSSYVLLAFAVVGVAAPATAVFWFMNEAASSQAQAARREVADAYRGQLHLLAHRADEWWKSHAAALDQRCENGNAADFLKVFKAAGADSVILLDGEGTVLYPAMPKARRRQATARRDQWEAAEDLEAEGNRLASAAAAWRAIADSERDALLAAIAAQAHVRCLLRNGDREPALAGIQRYFSAGRTAQAIDREGRHIGADEHLLALRLMRRTDPRYGDAALRLSALLRDYGGVNMLPAQRLFLMRELRALAPAIPPFETFEAERLAAEYLEAETPRASSTGLAPSGITGVWKLGSPGGRVVALYRTETVVAATGHMLGGQSAASAVRFAVAPPGSPATAEAIPAGAMLPGWQLSFTLIDSRDFDQAGRRSRAMYLAIGSSVIAAVAVSGLVLGRSFRRQVRLTRLKTDLVSAVSHELKTPLASMRLLVDSLLEDERPDAKRTQDYLQLIAGENVRLTRLIENFLTFSRIDRNRQTFVREKLEPVSVVKQALAAFRERAQAPGCSLEVEVEADLPALYADREALTTVILNLLDNAWKYSGSDKRIGVRVRRDDHRVVLSVTDNGAGIPPRERKKIFRAFYQVDRRLARETGGCGLGLSIVEYMVRAHGGTVTVDSQPGVGSTFRVALPFASEEGRT